MSLRLRAMGQRRYRNGFRVTLHPDALGLPLRWATPQMIFVNSMGDLFHRDVSVQFIREVFATMERAAHHTFQVLTKRAQRLACLAPDLPWPPNVWAGVSVETQEYISRIAYLEQVPAAVRFASLEPLLGPLDDLPVATLDWVIVGGESGPGARPVRIEWVRSVRDQCLRAGVPFFFKQWGGVHRTKSGRKLDGRMWEQYPPASRR
jgi:protein gp37